MSGLIWIQTVGHSECSRNNFLKKLILKKKSADDSKSMTNYPAFKESFVTKLSLNAWYTLVNLYFDLLVFMRIAGTS